MTHATLTATLHTPLGIYPAGLPITIIQTGRQRTKICLDPPGTHLTTRCHTIHTPNKNVEPSTKTTPHNTPT